MAGEFAKAQASRLGENAEPEEIVGAELIVCSPCVRTPELAIRGRRLTFPS